jgi:hypothetical protein
MLVRTNRTLRDKKTGRFVANPDAKIKFNCLVCGKEFERHKCEARKAVRHYCSEQCQSKDSYYRRGKAHHNYNHITVKCEYCNQEFLTTPSRRKNGRRFCSYTCSNNFRRILDPNSYSYNHNTARRIYNTLKYIDKCEICGILRPLTKVHNHKHELIIHHKDGNMKNNIIKNLQVLCRSCHTRHHKKGFKVQRLTMLSLSVLPVGDVSILLRL